MLKLQFKDQTKAPIWLTDEHFSIGQDDRNSLPLKHKSVSAHHAEVGREGDVFYISDMGSLTGTFVNGKRVNKRFQLRAGDIIRVGDIEFELTDPTHGTKDEAAAPHIPLADWCVQAISGSLKGKTFPILNAITIGRSSSCEIHLSQEKVSRKHAELIAKGSQLILRDLGSSNGTVVNQKKISEATLTAGDQFHINNNSFLVIGPKLNNSAENEDEPTIFGAATIVTPPTVANKTQGTSHSSKDRQKPKVQRPNLDSLKSSNDRVSLNATSKGPSYVPALVLGIIALSALAAVAFIMQ